MTSQAFLDGLAAIVGSSHVLTGSDVSSRQAGGLKPTPLAAGALVRPADTVETSAVMKLCYSQGVAVVPSGGNTGLVGGTQAGPGEIALSVERMRTIEPVDISNRAMTVGSGVVLEQAQEAAAADGLLFPVDLGARGSAMVGGLIATNAGGNGVLRYGMMRDNVLGIEAVLADGTVISDMNLMVKNNTGFDLRQIFVGSEGTLGIITRAVLRLRPSPRSRNTAFVACPSFGAMTKLLSFVEAELGGGLSAFEAMWDEFYQLIAVESGQHVAPFDSPHPFYVLVEAHGGHQRRDGERFLEMLGEAEQLGLIADAVVAYSQADRDRLWAIRDDIPSLLRLLGTRFAYDVSLSLDEMEGYLDRVFERTKSLFPDARLVVFGHLGDGNLHVTLKISAESDAAKLAVDLIVYEELRGGSISAEHGIGIDKLPFLHFSRSPQELALMRTIKAALDPKNILSPGRVIPKPN